MKSRMIRTLITIHDCPNGDMEKYLVCQLTEDGYHLWGQYKDRTRAYDIAKIVKGEVITRC